MRPKPRIIALLGLLLGTSAMCSGQTSIGLHDVSDEGSPVRVSGTISLQDDPSKGIRYTYRTEGYITNVSDRNVVLTVIHFETSGLHAPGLSNNYVVDRFFGPTVLHAGEAERIIHCPLPLGVATVDGRPMPENVGPSTEPTATAEVTFVQFVDGSTWGDVDSGRQFIRGRKNSLRELERLEQVLSEKGTDAFQRELETSGASLEFFPTAALVGHCGIKASSCLMHGFKSVLHAATQLETELPRESWDISAQELESAARSLSLSE